MALPRRPQRRSHGLDLLPTEILLQIRSLLSACSTATLALTCKRMLGIVGDHAFKQLRNLDRHKVNKRADIELRDFLLLLERDVPRSYACLECLKLHSFGGLARQSKASSKKRPPNDCRELDMKAEVKLFAGRGIGFFHFHFAMQEYRSTLNPSAIQRLSFSNSRVAIEFRIRNGKVLMRGQHRLEFDRFERVKVINRALQSICVCNDIKDFTHYRTLPEVLTNSFRPGALLSCPFCPTEFQVDISSSSSNGYEMVVTRWLDLGDCSSPNEPHYRSHMTLGSVDFVEGVQVPLVAWKPGSIKAAFENSGAY